MTKSLANQIRLSFITINYNGLNDTLELLKSIYSTIQSISFEVIVVDNASTDRSESDTISTHFPQVKIIRSEINLGFAGGNNLGIDQADGEYVMLINNDTLIPYDNFSVLLERFEKDPSIGAISPKILFAKPENTIQFAGYTKLSPITMRNSLIGFMEPDNSQYPPAETPYCHGAAMIVKNKAITDAGKMFEGYFLYYEELDWSCMISRAGYKLWYDPSQTVIHKESGTVGALSSMKTYYLTRNRLLFAKRNIFGIKRSFSIIYQLLLAAPKGFFVYLMKGKKDNASAVIKGCRDFLKNNNKS